MSGTWAYADAQSCLSPATIASSASRVWRSLPQARAARFRTCRPVRLSFTRGEASTKRRRLLVFSSNSARDVLETAKQKFEEGDRMGALRQFETAIRQPLSPQERREALYGATVVHASFGDIEQAQVSLRESLEAGLDFESALSDDGMLRWKSSPQVLSQLRKFARTLQQIREAVAPAGRGRGAEVGAPPPARRDAVGYAAGRERIPKPDPNMSLSEMLRTDITGMDATVSGIVKRVLLLIVVGITLGAILFYVGLELSGIAR